MKILQFALIGLGTGAIYTMAAQAIVLVYRGSGILNFASGAIGMLGAELFYELKDQDGVNIVFALLAGLGLSVGLAAGMQVLVLRRLKRATGLTRIIATLGLFTGLVGIGLEIFGAEFRLAVSELPQTPQDVFGLLDHSTIGLDRFLLLGIGIVLTAVLTLVYRRTRFGFVTSAVAENEQATAALGWSPNLVATVNWALGGLLAGIAAILLAPIAGGPGLVVLDLSLLVIPALAAALIGRFASFPLTLLGALVIGVLESELSYLVSQPDALPPVLRTTGLAKAVPFLVIVATLVVRGRGLPVRGEIAARLPALGTGRIRWIPALAATIAAAVLIWAVFDPAWTDAFITTATVGLVALSLVVVTGYAGQLSIAQFALAGIGGWAAARAAHAWSAPFELALVIGVVSAAAVGVLVALPSLRTRGVNLAIATLGMAVAIESLVLANPELTTEGGVAAGTVVDPPELLGWPIDRLDHPDRYATVCLLALVIVMIGVANLRRGRAGRRLVAVRGNERAAASLGISVFGAKVYAFALSATIAGIAGVLISFRVTTITFVSDYSVQQSINVVVYAVIGSIGFLLGPVVGAMFALGTLGPRVFESVLGSDLANTIQIVGGFGLIATLMTAPDGIAANMQRPFARLARQHQVRDATDEDRARMPLSVPRQRVSPVTFRAEELTVHFGGVLALERATVEARPGEIVGLIGPNGAGKTTLIDAATGFVRPSSGKVLLNGQSVTALNPRQRARRGLARSFQSLELFDDMTVRDNLRTASDPRDSRAYVTDVFRPGNPPLSAAALAAVHEFGLASALDRQPNELSFGARRLVAIARAVAMRPSVLLLDEPAAGLDDRETAELGDLIRRLAVDWGIAIVLIEHDVGLVLRVCDRIVALDFGKTIAVGTPEEIRHHPAVIDAYLGETPDRHARRTEPKSTGDRAREQVR